jgi:hypothetical protein
MQKSSAYDLFSDYEGTLVFPEISYKDWVLPRVEDKDKFLAEYEIKRNRARSDGTPDAQAEYLNLYSKLLTLDDFRQISLKYTMNKAFTSWCKRFTKAHAYRSVKLTIITRGFAPIVKNYFERYDTKSTLSSLGISLSTVIGSEPIMDKKGVLKEVASAINSKRKYVRDGHVMLGDEKDEKEFSNYPYFVNLSKWMKSEDY